MNAYTQGSSGGDERFIQIARRLASLEIVVVTSQLGRLLCCKMGLRARYVITTHEARMGSVTVLYLQRIIRALSLHCNDYSNCVVYSTSDFLPDVVPAFVWRSRSGSARWIQVVHHLYTTPATGSICRRDLLTRALGFLMQRASLLLMRRADVIVAVSDRTRQQLLRIGFDRKKVKLNHNGVDVTKIKHYRPSGRGYDCVFLGRLNPSKGIFDLVKIWKAIVRTRPSVTLAVIGGGDPRLEHDLKNSVRANGLEKNIHVLGYLEDEEAFGILKSSRVFVFPSYEEGFGIAVLEAMACGLPVVSWDLPIYREICPGGSARVTIGDNERFAERILALLDNESLYSDMMTEAQRTAAKYDWERTSRMELVLIQAMQDSACQRL